MANARPRGFNDRLIDDFRAHGGQTTSGPFTGRSLLLLTTKGARTGKERTSPLAYSRAGPARGETPAFADYEKRTARKIPVVVLERI